MNLTALLHSTFGFSAFRANQEAVCRAASEGRDVLLVMPTGAGKSLCYQLPALARGGPALVVSPLIALMEDQSAKLSKLGLKVARIHSGIPREDSRQACRDYLDGSLQFLFIAPERMRVPGFPQMLARRTPSLVAIDEAHCISAWGHDFRPDYRTLGEHLPALRPAPVIALTATATPTVQRDIAAQLRLQEPAFFIHGFRRSNLAIEVVEKSKPQRNSFTTELLGDKERRPAIIYAPSRKDAENLAGELAHRFPAAAYHAGLDPATRDRVQTEFLAGKLDVVVATIAFGMGIDKADVRTVIHTALPASVEAYYQEIGRAGRDGLPSRTVLLHSYADRKLHEFFFERDYPPATDLGRVARVLTDEYLLPEPLARELKMDPYQFQKAIEKLVAQGAAAIDVAGNVRRIPAGMAARGSASWQSGYEAQLAFRKAQLGAMAAFAETAQCRMSALVRHFGDTADSMRPCGQCDVCAPESTRAQTFRPPTDSEARLLRAILGALQHAPSRAAGKLHSDLGGGMERRGFDTLLDALSRAGLVTISSETFQKPDGSTIHYKKVTITHDGRHDDAAELAGVLLPESVAAETGTARRTRDRRSSSSPPTSTRSREREQPEPVLTPDQKRLEDELRAWRKAEAAKTGKPAFIVFGDSVLRKIAAAQPQTVPELLNISGIGPNKADTYGSAVIAICRGGSSTKVQGASTLSRSKPVSSSSQPVDVDQRFNRSSEDLRPFTLNTSAGRRRAKDYDEAAYRRLDFEQDLRNFALSEETEEKRLGTVLSESAIAEILLKRPQNMARLRDLEHLRGDLPETFYQSLLTVCLDEPDFLPNKPSRASVAVNGVSVRDGRTAGPSPEDRPQRVAYTPHQQALDLRLRDWRKAESERLGLPQFFVLATSALRATVLAQPRTLDDLRAIPGLDPEKISQFGSAILGLCNP